MPITGGNFAFTESNVNKAPAEHGVYALYDRDVTTYIGRASGDGVTIRSRLKNITVATRVCARWSQPIIGGRLPRVPSLVKANFSMNTRRYTACFRVACGLPRCNDRRT
jgi:hypothetical protein